MLYLFHSQHFCVNTYNLCKCANIKDITYLILLLADITCKHMAATRVIQ